MVEDTKSQVDMMMSYKYEGEQVHNTSDCTMMDTTCTDNIYHMYGIVIVHEYHTYIVMHIGTTAALYGLERTELLLFIYSAI